MLRDVGMGAGVAPTMSKRGCTHTVYNWLTCFSLEPLRHEIECQITT